MSSSAAKHDVFQAIADPTRRQLLHLLAQQEMSVTVISGHFPMSRTAVSKHLRVLSEAGLVREQKVGRETRYRMQPEPLIELKDWLSHYERFWENKMQALRRFVEEDPDEDIPPAKPHLVKGQPKKEGQ
ncbi:ArsR/SmtB family transcription factor [Brevibacillus choshinensis]|uniref:Winged helix-turn-helix transcriptional regulator n=1 Tax=Brevibacillus choshinensis TaxID=54911 RepID=A0ABX7FVU6_BRECH|nr:metalloregulator ArsR/SmtB family transcription factor [Brevibacillus choshinensis]QRG69130.1 winged helix-turn-helix transcriptional regulator [Brevibacillus choshinensis]